MTLPGKLAIGFLQEDNPQKFYFRVRPALIADEAGYHLAENAGENYPDDGFIRIVPDRNELNHFKNRMRALGRYCAIDLKKHSGENDKIRPNKNHSGENGDRNAYIVYSDVIQAVPPLQMAEVAVADADGLFPLPHTALVALCREGQLRGLFRWNIHDEGRARVDGECLADAQALESLPAIDLQTPEGEDRRLIMDLDRLNIESDQVHAALLAYQAVRERIANAHPEQQSLHPAPEQAAPEQAARPSAPAEAPRQETARDKEREAAKPWLQPSPHPSVPRAAMARNAGPREQSLAQQSGFNPKRGASIKDIIDDMWRHSRYDQLGHPVTPDAAAAPVTSPVDHAMDAFKEAWALPEARGSLISALLKMEDLDRALGAAGVPDAARTRAENEGEARLTRLEADRLKLLGEIDELKRFRQDKRAELIEEMRRAHQAEFDKSQRQLDQLRQAQADCEKKAHQAHAAWDAARQAFAQGMEKDLDQKMAQELLRGRARELMAAMGRGRVENAQAPKVESPSAGEMISALRVRFESAGLPLSNDEAVNLLILTALGRILIVSGPCASDRDGFVRVLAGSLGIASENSGCFEEIQAQRFWRNLGREIETVSPSGVAETRLPRLRRLLENGQGDTPAMLLIDEANRGNMDEYLGELALLGEKGAPQALRTGAGEIALGDRLRLVMTVRDEGMSVSGEMLDRAWLIRLDPPAADEAWPPREAVLPRPDAAFSLEGLKKVFAPGADVPGEIADRLRVLREKLAEKGLLLSRRTLNDLYRYCSAAIPHMTCAPMEVLDFALSQRAMPMLLATGNLEALHALGQLLPDMPRCLRLMGCALPLPPL